MATTYIGNAYKSASNPTGWRRQQGVIFGTSEEKEDYIEIPYRGPFDTAKDWAKTLKLGEACPISPWGHCKLVKWPDFRAERDTPMAEAVLRFTGPTDLERPGPGVDGTDPEFSWGAESQIVELVYEGRNCSYRYDAPFVTGTFTSSSFPKFDKNGEASSGITKRLEKELGRVDDKKVPIVIKPENAPAGQPPFPLAATINENFSTYLKRDEVSQFLSAERSGAESFRITERRIRYLKKTE